MRAISKAGHATVKRFSIKRANHSRIVWEGAMDVCKVELDTVVRVRERNVMVYKRKEANRTKPWFIIIII